MLVIIDGLSCAGKTSIARRIAQEMRDFQYLSVGSIYRAVAAYFLVTMEPLAVCEISPEQLTKLQIMMSPDQQEFYFDKDITARMYSLEVTKVASHLGTRESITQTMIDMIRRITSNQKNTIVDGREVAYRAFPDADVKIFLKADLEIRLARYLNRHVGEDPIKVREHLLLKDKLDGDFRFAEQVRKASVMIDTTGLSLEDSTNRVKSIIVSYTEDL